MPRDTSGSARSPARDFLVALLLPVALLGGCGSSDPVRTDEPQPPALEVQGGVFDVMAQIIFDTCGSDAIYDGAYAIQIDGLTFSMGDEWSGAWDPKTARGYGESEHTSYTVRVCTVTRWTSVTVAFKSEDEFTGSIVFHQLVEGECNTPCITSWTTVGVRQ